MTSIIIPVYNTEKYIGATIQSIVGQSCRDWELLLIDDGSTDSSAKICRDWQSKDRRIRYVHQDNSGVSSARNHGLKLAEGQYIMFVDSDDLCDSRLLEALVGSIKGHDIACCGVERFQSGYEPALTSDKGFSAEIIRSKSEMFRRFADDGFLHPPYAKLYRSDVITYNRLRFYESLSLGEDMCFNLDYLQHASSCAIIDSPLYYYRDTEDSLSKKIRGDYADIQLMLFDRKQEFINKNELDYDLSAHASAIVRDMFLSVCRSDGTFARKAESIERMRHHPIMKMCKSHRNVSDFALQTIIKYIPTWILTRVFR